MINRFRKCERGATAVEYGLILGVLSLVVAYSAGEFGTALRGLFVENENSISNAFK